MLSKNEKYRNNRNLFHQTYKWVVLFSFSLNSISNVFLFTALSPIWSSVALYYNTTDYHLNWFLNCYYISLIIFALLFNPVIINHFGVSQILSCCLTTFGLWLLVYVGPNYYLGLLSFSFIGLGQALFFQVPLYLSKLWFDPQERILSTFIGQYANNLGMLLGYIVSTVYFYNIFEQQEFEIRYKFMIQINAILASIALVANLAILRKPGTSSQIIEIRDSNWNSFYKIITTRESIYDIGSVSSIIGLSWCYTTLFATQQYQKGQTYYDVSEVNIMFQAGQIIAALICTCQLQKQSNAGMQQQYDGFIKYTLGIGFQCLILEIVLFEYIPVLLLGFLNLLIGAGLGGLYSVLLESLMEKNYPVHELVIGSILAAVAGVSLISQYCQSVSLIITMILVIPEVLQYGFQISCYLMIPQFSYISVFYETQFKRFELES